ncbi:DNA polymerase I [Deltaproteobacteria bacterium Smac51]|nr:DNA polymerase I [Deltaproteobacteria bacterium Smac51]
MTPIYLMDASAFIHRSFHAIRNLTTKDGRPTGAAYGFTATVLKLLKDKKPQALAVVFDSRGPSRRHEIYPEYKANRGPMDEDLAVQQAPIREIVAALGLYGLERPGFEADDLIAVATRFFSDQGREVVIVSSDKDFYQLLSDRVSMYDPDPKKDSALTQAAFMERFGVEPASFLEMQALMGDSSDNIPGVPKVGEKTAQKLITTFKTLDNLYAHLDEVNPERLRDNLYEHKKDAYLSRELASLGHGAKVDFSESDLKPAEPDRPRLIHLFQDLEFNRLLKDLVPAGEESVDSATPDQPAVKYDDYVLVDSPSNWKKLEAALASAKMLSVDLETDSLSPSRCCIVGMSLCAEPGYGFYIPIAHQTLSAGPKNQSWETVAEKVGPYLENEALPKIGQNVKFDWLILRRHGINPNPPSDDPMLASYLLDPESRHGMDHLSLRFLGHQPIAFKDMVPEPNKKNFGDLEPEDALNYAAEDADVTLRLASLLRGQLEEAGSALMNLYRQVELPLEDLLARMEETGVLIDAERLGALSKELTEQLKTIESKIYELAGRRFNIGSPKQLSEVLFNEQGLSPIKKTAKKTGFSTDDAVLAELALLHPLPLEIRNWRSLDKLRSTYTDKLPKEINPATGRVHTWYNQTLTSTGRLSSSDPNLQNIPVRGEEGRRIRSAFIAPEGFRILSADYSQIELRVLAHFSQDASLLNAFENDEDIHTQTAVEIFGLPAEEVTAQQRREAKTINFGVVYGQGPFALGKQLGIPQAQARDFIDRYFARFPGVKRYMEETREAARVNGLVTTWFGRRRWLKGLTGGYQARQEAERMAINTPIQGTAADLIKMAMLAVDARLKKESPLSRLIMQVHDELVLEVPQAEVAAVAELVRSEMAGVAKKPPLEGAEPLTVKLKVDVGHGPDWSTAH